MIAEALRTQQPIGHGDFENPRGTDARRDGRMVVDVAVVATSSPTGNQ